MNEALKVHSLVEPDRDMMRAHVEHLFGDWLDGCHDGQIEVVYSDAKTHQLSQAQWFGTDRIDDLVEFAATQNRKLGVNVYVGAALRSPSCAPFGRAKDEDFYALTAFYADIDDDVTARAAATCENRGCAPTGMVVTGKHPHVRIQMYWRLNEPCRDPALTRQQNKALATALEGDPTVVNPGRVLRLGGSIAWPIKSGRVIEVTEWVASSADCPTTYHASDINKAFPFEQGTLAEERHNAPSAVPTAKVADPANSVRTAPPSHNDGNPFSIPGVRVDDCIAAIRRGDHWHNNMLRLVGHRIALGCTDNEIMAEAEGYTLAGYSTAQTRREVAVMVEGGRRKWEVPNPPAQPAAALNTAFNLMDWTAARYAGEAKDIEWLIQGCLPLGIPSLFAAMGGLGKSFIALDLAMAIATGGRMGNPHNILGGPVVMDGAAVVLSAEDGFNAIHRRLNRIDPASHRLLADKRLVVVPMSDAGGTQQLVAGDGRTLVRTPFFHNIK